MPSWNAVGVTSPNSNKFTMWHMKFGTRPLSRSRLPFCWANLMQASGICLSAMTLLYSKYKNYLCARCIGLEGASLWAVMKFGGYIPISIWDLIQCHAVLYYAMLLSWHASVPVFQSKDVPQLHQFLLSPIHICEFIYHLSKKQAWPLL